MQIDDAYMSMELVMQHLEARESGSLLLSSDCAGRSSAWSSTIVPVGLFRYRWASIVAIHAELSLIALEPIQQRLWRPSIRMTILGHAVDEQVGIAMPTHEQSVDPTHGS